MLSIAMEKVSSHLLATRKWGHISIHITRSQTAEDKVFSWNVLVATSQFHSPTTLQPHSPATLQPHRPAALQPHSPTASYIIRHLESPILLLCKILRSILPNFVISDLRIHVILALSSQQEMNLWTSFPSQRPRDTGSMSLVNSTILLQGFLSMHAI